MVFEELCEYVQDEGLRVAALEKGAVEESCGKEERAEGKEVVGRVGIQKWAKPGDTRDGKSTGGNEERNRREGYAGWEKRGQRGT